MVPVHDAYNLFDRVRIFVFLLLQNEWSTKKLEKIWLDDLKQLLLHRLDRMISKMEINEEKGEYLFHYSTVAGEDASGDDHGYEELVVVRVLTRNPTTSAPTSCQIWYKDLEYYIGEGKARFCLSPEELFVRNIPHEMKRGWGLKMFRENTPVLL